MYYIFRKLSHHEEEELLKNSLKNGGRVYCSKKSYLSTEFLKQQKVSSTSAEQLSSLNNSILTQVVDFGHKKINNKSTAELLAQHSSSLWYYLRFSIYHRSKELIVQHKLIDEQEKKLPSSSIQVYTDQGKLARYLGNNCKVIKARGNNQSSKTSYFLKYSFLLVFRFLSGTVLLPFKIKRKKKNVILFNLYNRQDVIDRATTKLKKGDPHLEYLIEDVCHNRDFIYLTQLRPPSLGDNHRLRIRDYITLSKYWKKTIPFEPFLGLVFFRPSFYKHQKLISNKSRQLVQELSNKKWEDTEEQIISDTVISSLKILKLVVWREKASELFHRLQPVNKLIGIDEHSLQNRSIISPLKEKGVKSVAIQHGGISKSNIAYLFNAADKDFTPWPELTLIRGNYTKEMLRQSFYPEQALKVVGHMRTDCISSVQHITIDQVIKGFNKKYPTILYATQPVNIDDRELRIQQYYDFFKVCKSIPEANFVVKPHPNENNHQLYYNIAKEVGTDNFVISSDNLYYLLAASDIVVTYFSTVGIEGIYFGKELVTLDYDLLDPQGYLKDKISHNVMNIDEFENTLIKLIAKEMAISEDQKEVFISNRTYAIDGLSTQRHLDAIKNA